MRKTMKKRIERNLPLNDKYFVESVKRSSLETLGASMVINCDNCGKAIINVATIKNTTGKRFNVGLDCLETLTNDIVNRQQAENLVDDYKDAFLKFGYLQNSTSIEFDPDPESEIIYINYVNRKGVLTSCYAHLPIFRRFGFDYAKELTRINGGKATK